MKIRELYSDETKWTKFALARNKNGVEIDYHDENAKSFCLLGAMHRCYGDNFSDWRPIWDLIQSKLPPMTGIIDFNNADSTKFADVKALVDELDI